jgi:hypothetical protein
VVVMLAVAGLAGTEGERDLMCVIHNTSDPIPSLLLDMILGFLAGANLDKEVRCIISFRRKQKWKFRLEAYMILCLGEY